jgi:hypothetical protein
MITQTDKNGNILQPSDKISLITSKGTLKAEVISLSENKISIEINGKIKELEYKKVKNKIIIDEIKDHNSENEKNIQPLLTELFNDTANRHDNYHPSTELNEMYDKWGIRTIPAVNDDSRYEYRKERLISLIKQAKSLTREDAEFKNLTEQFNKMLNQLISE